MRTRFFGDPWPSEEKRAPICDDDTYKVPIEHIISQRCVDCGKPFTEKDHGVITACTASVWHHFWVEVEPTPQDTWDEMEPEEGPLHVTVCAYHLRCWLREVVGGEMSEVVLSRMTGQGYAHLYKTNKPEVETAPTEDAEIGKGWSR